MCFSLSIHSRFKVLGVEVKTFAVKTFNTVVVLKFSYGVNGRNNTGNLFSLKVRSQ